MSARRFDDVSAIRDAKAALDLSEGPARVSPLYQLASYTRFDGDGAAIAYTTEALQLTSANPDVTKPALAVARALHGRALMAADRVEEARKELSYALADAGGLTNRVDLSDVAIRYDLAQANLMLNRRDEARKYLAYTGAGRISGIPFERADIMEAPACGVVPGMTPDAYAIVEFGLGEDGSVQRVEPIYAKGGRETALAFAKAVQDWSWSAESAKVIPAFYRMMTRVEMRCTQAGERTGVMDPLSQQVAAWFEEKGQSSESANAALAARLPALRAQAGASDVSALSANLMLAASDLIPKPEQQAAAGRARQLADTLGAPQAVRTRIAIAMAAAQITEEKPVGDAWRRHQKKYAAALRPLLAQPEIAGDPLSAATLRLSIATALIAAKDGTDANPLIDAVANTKDLPDRHPLRTSALLMKANRAAAAGDLKAAGDAFALTGLSEQQCALIGPRPAMKSNGASRFTFPEEARQMGFEGWAKVEYDIDQNGRTASRRTLLAYPPFVFGDAAVKMLANARFETSYRPQTGLACSANHTSVNFRQP